MTTPLDHEPRTVYALKQLAVDGFELTTALQEGQLRLELGPSAGVVGTISSFVRGTVIDATTAETISFRRVQTTGEGGFSATGDLRAHRMAVRLALGGVPMTGHAGADVLETTRLELTTAEGGPVIVEGASASMVRVDTEAGSTTIGIDRLRCATLKVAVATGSIQLDDLVLEGIRVVIASGRDVAVEIASLRMGQLALHLDGQKAEAHDLVVEGVKLSGARHVETGPITCRQVRGTWPLTDEASPPSNPRRDPPPLDLTFLRHLEGHLHADITSEIDVPILGEWHAQHRLRLDVHGGRVEYRRLERGLGKLPDAVLDFNLRDGVLSFDRDIPLVPFDRTPLLTWPLSDEERGHAGEGWVALATLLRPTVEIEPDPEGDDEGTGWLQAIIVRGIDVDLALGAAGALALPAGGSLVLGAGSTAAMARLHLTGGLTYATGTEQPPGQLTLRLEHLAASLADLPAGGRRIGAEGLAVAEAQADLPFAGIAPTRLTFRLEQLRCTSLRTSSP